jgi:hypothetical protein
MVGRSSKLKKIKGVFFVGKADSFMKEERGKRKEER